MKQDEKLKNVFNGLVNRGIDQDFSQIPLRQLIRREFNFVEESRVRDLLKGLLNAHYIIKVSDKVFRLGDIAYIDFNLSKPKVEVEADKEIKEIKEILGARLEVE